MNFRRSYKAFTLWEMMVALLITSLIVTMSYGAYWTFSRVLKEDQEKQEGLIAMIFLERDLHRLADSCLSMELVDDVLYFNHRDSYTYMEFSDSTLIWGDEVAEEERIFRVGDWSVEYLDEQSDFIKSLKLPIVQGRVTWSISLKKTYPRAFLYSMKKE